MEIYYNEVKSVIIQRHFMVILYNKIMQNYHKIIQKIEVTENRNSHISQGGIVDHMGPIGI